MCIKFIFLLELLRFSSSDGIEMRQWAPQTMKVSIRKSATSFHSGLNRLSNSWLTNMKPTFNMSKLRVRRKFRRFKFSELVTDVTQRISPYINNTINETTIDSLRLFNDPFLPSQFYMVPTKKSPEHRDPYDINVLPIWIKDQNFGKNIRIIILADDIDTTHEELKDNFDPDLSLDCSTSKLLASKWPLNNDTVYEGTEMAGIIAMKANNRKCGVGVAPEVKFGVIRFSSMTNENFAQTLLFSTKADIFFTSWVITYTDYALSPYIGPILQAYEETITKGRDGRGVIHVVPVGNRGHELYMCGSNVILQSIYTIGVTGSEYDGRSSNYSEYCAGVMVTAYSNFGIDDKYRTVVPDINGSCTQIHGGSGTAAALVAGVISLALAARPTLNWREIQHAIVWTSEISPLLHDPLLWKMNGAGFYVSEFFGFGMINAYNLVKFAKRMKHIPPMISCTEAVYDHSRHGFTEHTSKEGREYKYRMANCTVSRGEAGQRVNYIEHVQVRVSCTYASKRGDIVITLKSPSGTDVLLLDRQPDDHSTKGMLEWYFDSVLMWGEPSEGEWTIKITKHFSVQNTPEIFVQRLYLLIHGTQVAPSHHYSTFGKKRKMRYYKKPIPFSTTN